jgi:hypothetical protein
VIDDFAKEYLRGELQEIRPALLWRLDGVGEYDVRRPLTSTGTNLLGLVKHLSIWESRYFGEVFDRPYPEILPRWDDAGEQGADLWATEHETRDEIINRYRRVWEHADATITALALDAPGRVPWWPRPDMTLFKRPGPHGYRDEPACRTRRHPARTARWLDRRTRRTRRPGARRGLLGSALREDRASREGSCLSGPVAPITRLVR